MREFDGPAIGVVGGSGGVGASTFAAVLAVMAGQSVLVDLDAVGGGVDVVLGVESAPGARWSGVRVAGGHLDPDVLVAGLPRAGPVAVLAADTTELDPGAASQVIEAARSLGPVVLDLPRHPTAVRQAGLDRCDLVLVLARGDAAGLVAAHAQVSTLADVPLGVVVRRTAATPERPGELIGAPLLGTLPELGPPVGRRFDARRLPRSSARVAAGVMAGLADVRAQDWTPPSATGSGRE